MIIVKTIAKTLCLGLILVVFCFSSVSAETVKFDVKPRRCPNPVNVASPGYLPAAILGTESFDVNDVDPATVLLEGVAPSDWHLEDVSTPVEPGGDPCDCTTDSADGFMDLHLKFPNRELVESLQAEAGRPLEDGEVIVLTFTGLTLDGTAIEGSDCIFVLNKRAISIHSESAALSPSTIQAKLDVKPRRCPNPVNVASPGYAPVAILGTESFDVNDVDPATVLLEGVAPSEWHLEDVSTPVEPGGDPCDCTTDSADGFMDLHLKFSNRELAESLDAQGLPEHGDVIVLTLTGMTHEGTAIEGSDCVLIINRRAIPISAEPPNLSSLGENFPNPFNPETDIAFRLAERQEVQLTIYNILGEKVKVLANGVMSAGAHTVRWDGRDEAGNSVSSGIYFYRLSAGDRFETKRMLLLK
jgi:hypothetical protein